MTASDLFFSIVIPSYNRASFLEQNLPLLTKLNYPRYEIIVVDDGSTDNTREVVGRFDDSRIRYFKKENAERAAARNFGADQSIGDYITFLDSDDLLFENALANAAAAVEEKNYPPFLHLAYEIGTTTLVDRTIRNLPDNDPLILVKGNPLSCMGVFLKREIFSSFRFNEDRALSGSEDWEFWVRLAANFGLRTDNRLSGRLIQHDTRSVVHVSEETLTKRMELAMRYAFEDEKVHLLFGKYRRTIAAHWETYVSLHLAMNGDKAAAWTHLIKAVKHDALSIASRRGLVILRMLALGPPKH